MTIKARDIRHRITSVESTKKITNAMQSIAARRILKAQARTEKSRPFSAALSEMIEMLASEAKSSPLLAERAEIANAGLIVVTGDRGLAGAYNSSILREATRAVTREQEAGRTVQITSIGRKGTTFFKFRKSPISASFIGVSDKPTYKDAAKIAKDVIEQFVAGDLDKVSIAYTDFVSASLQRARVAQILPVPRPEGEQPTGEPRALFDFEPEPDVLLDALLPRYVEMKVYAALLESSTSEHAARMRAMKSATDRAEDLIKLYTQQANKARQSEITNEIADIVGATEALRGA